MASARESRILLNLGGIANFTFLPNKDASKVFVTDTGPGNTLIDQCVRLYFPKKDFDKDSRIALAGKCSVKLLAELKKNAFFKRSFPKTTGPELFNLDFVRAAQRKSNTTTISPADLIRTLTVFSAETVTEAVLCTTKGKKFAIYFSGGGAHNPLLSSLIMDRLGIKTLLTTDALGVPGDAKEAMLFAVLANECVAGTPIDFGGRAKVPSVTMGKISFPW